jgi:DNA-binding CsgD family transcriptional regulator
MHSHRDDEQGQSSNGGYLTVAQTVGLSSAERLSELIGYIYDCALNPANWEPVLAAVCREFSFASSLLGVQRLQERRVICQISTGLEPELVARIPNYVAEINQVWRGADHATRFPLDEPIVLSQAVDLATLRANRYIQEFTGRGIADAVTIMLADDANLSGNLGFNRHRSAGRIVGSEVDGLRLLAPHFRRAVTIGDLFDMKAIEAASLGSVLDSFAFGVALVDEQLSVIHANAAAATMFAARDPIEVRRGILAIREKASNAALERAVTQAKLDESGMGARGIGIPARRAEGEPCVVHVLPLRRGELRRGVGPRATAALFVAPASARPRLPSDALALLYDLTPAETRILEMITAGMAQSTIATTIGVARSTVKTHVLRLFDKTGCKRQVDLVRLAAGLSLSV